MTDIRHPLPVDRFVQQCFAFDALPSKVNAGVPLDVSFLILEEHPSNQLLVERTSKGRVLSPVRGSPDGRDPTSGAQRFRALLPALAPDEEVEYQPVLSRAGFVVKALPSRSTLGVRALAAPTASNITPAVPTTFPQFQWEPEFLGATTIQLAYPPESFGPGPDGLHLTVYVVSGEIHGPKINAKIRGEGGDWMLVRRDGVGVADARITYETDDGALLLSRYSGIFDLGANGYKLALHNEYDPFPPFVLAPQFITSHPNWLWLNRAQCLAVGRARMAQLLVLWDLYAIRVGQAVSI